MTWGVHTRKIVLPGTPVGQSSLTCGIGLLVVVLLLSSCTEGRHSGFEKESIPAGWEFYRLGEFDKAVEVFRNISGMVGPEEKDLAAQALFGEASCWHYRRDGRDTSRAAALYHSLIKLAPEHPLVPWSELAKVRIHHFGQIEPKPDYDALAREYAEVYGHYPFHLAGQEAFVNRFFILLYDPSPEVARQYLPELKEFLTRNPESPFQSAVCKLIASCYSALKEPEESLAWLIRALETRELDQSNPNTNNSGPYWSIARAAEYEAGNFECARLYYQRLINEYPKDQRIYEAKRALRRMKNVEDIVRRGGDPSSSSGEPGS